MNPLTALLEDHRDRVLGQPDDLELGPERPELIGDRDVPLGMSQADGGRQEQCPARPGQGSRPALDRHLSGLPNESMKARMARFVRTGSRAQTM